MSAHVEAEEDVEGPGKEEGGKEGGEGPGREERGEEGEEGVGRGGAEEEEYGGSGDALEIGGGLEDREAEIQVRCL